jgi:hypothetical protein
MDGQRDAAERENDLIMLVLKSNEDVQREIRESSKNTIRQITWGSCLTARGNGDPRCRVHLNGFFRGARGTSDGINKDH